ncbi:MAG TPA: aldehyde dehydrogenase family protein [Kutzneria sp.]|nr:aldehyde dehydrogenase family protein [Kutzneria sp.]
MSSVDVRLVSEGSVWSTQTVARRCAALARKLTEDGLRAGDRVALVGANSAEYVLALLTLIHLDVSIMLLDEHQSAEDRAPALRSVQWVLGSDAVAADVVPSRASRGVRVVRLADVVPAADANVTDEPLALDFTAWWRRRDALVLLTSGTTGAPTIIVRSGRSVRNNIDATARRMGYRDDDVMLPMLPFSHQYGLSLLLLWWQSRCCLVIVPRARLDRAVEAITSMRVTVVDTTPSTYDSLLRVMEHRHVTRDQLAHVRMWCVGGAPLGSTLIARFREFTGKPLLDGYGSSEAGNIALASPGDEALCGKPLDGFEVDVLDDKGHPVPAGVVGELVVRGEDLLVGTIDTDGRFVESTRTLYHTNDIGYLDEDGNVAVLGRKGAVHRHGHTLYPEALARKAETLGAPVRVVALEHERRGSKLVFVVADESGRDPKYWRRVFGERLAVHEQPNQVLVVHNFPLNHNGKVDQRALRELAAGQLRDDPDEVFPVPMNGMRPDLGRIPLAERVDALHKVEQYLREHRDEVLSVLTEMSNYRTAAGELNTALGTLKGAAAEVALWSPPLVGRTAVFMPSNVPLFGYVLYLLVPALYSEEVVFRPSAHIRRQLIALHELLAPVHQLPITLSTSTQKEFITGETASSEVVVFTGAYSNAEKIRAQLRPDQLFVYYGQGINPFVVGPGADVDLAVTDLLEIRLLNSGQDCFGPDLVCVHESLEERFFATLGKRIDELVLGERSDPKADYSPMFYEQAFGFALEYLHRNARHIVHGGRVDLSRMSLEPTVLRRPKGHKVTCDELFAPIFNVVVYGDQRTLHDILTLPFLEERAMGAMVYGDLPDTVKLLRKRHEVCLNTTLLEADDGNAPFGGRGMVANYVAYQGRRIAEPLLISKVVADYIGAGRQQLTKGA